MNFITFMWDLWLGPKIKIKNSCVIIFTTINIILLRKKKPSGPLLGQCGSIKGTALADLIKIQRQGH
ncbi:hypothetical protein Anas_04134 [Armadillidium nasatum]|uniref:Uncharacterized protein n=1 Tax=Armadillidium nasatum TaxID=96803 RepID=A0A5N5TBZ9_9CRUS|nr:hypothetical protein Anas_04134 [Armadillidium nasatum]